MQEFLINNTITCNLISLTGYRTLIILNELLEGPKTLNQINEKLKDNIYIKKSFSYDTLRLYINALRIVGCDITKASKFNENKFILNSHPFNFKFSKNDIDTINNLTATSHKLDIKCIIKIESAIDKLAKIAHDDSIFQALQKNLLLKKINFNTLNSIIKYSYENKQLTMIYNSPKSGEIEILIKPDKIFIKNKKLYLAGNDITHNNYSFFPVERIIKINNTDDDNNETNYNKCEITLQIFDKDYEIKNNSELIKIHDDSVIVKMKDDNEFIIMQKILALGDKCKIIHPINFKNKFIEKLQEMRELYE